jgi:hypothetical protein
MTVASNPAAETNPTPAQAGDRPATQRATGQSELLHPRGVHSQHQPGDLAMVSDEYLVGHRRKILIIR